MKRIKFIIHSSLVMSIEILATLYVAIGNDKGEHKLALIILSSLIEASIFWICTTLLIDYTEKKQTHKNFWQSSADVLLCVMFLSFLAICSSFLIRKNLVENSLALRMCDAIFNASLMLTVLFGACSIILYIILRSKR